MRKPEVDCSLRGRVVSGRCSYAHKCSGCSANKRTICRRHRRRAVRIDGRRNARRGRSSRGRLRPHATRWAQAAAGRGGLNLTHSEAIDRFMARYREAAPRLAEAITAFPPEKLRAWCEGLGQETFVGSSGRVFPARHENVAASPRVANALGFAWRRNQNEPSLDRMGRLATVVRHPGRQRPGRAALHRVGTGREGGLGRGWVRTEPGRRSCVEAGITVVPLAPTNCGVRVAWSEIFRARYPGAPLKRIALSLGNETSRGEAMITADGLEGGAVYALSAPIRDALHQHGAATLTLDLRPDVSVDEIVAKLAKPRAKQSLRRPLCTARR